MSWTLLFETELIYSLKYEDLILTRTHINKIETFVTKCAHVLFLKEFKLNYFQLLIKQFSPQYFWIIDTKSRKGRWNNDAMRFLSDSWYNLILESDFPRLPTPIPWTLCLTSKIPRLWLEFWFEVPLVFPLSTFVHFYYVSGKPLKSLDQAIP